MGANGLRISGGRGATLKAASAGSMMLTKPSVTINLPVSGITARSAVRDFVSGTGVLLRLVSVLPTAPIAER